MGILEILGFPVPILFKFLDEWNILGKPEREAVLLEGGDSIAALINALQKVQNGEDVDLTSLRLDESLGDVLKKMQGTN